MAATIAKTVPFPRAAWYNADVRPRIVHQMYAPQRLSQLEPGHTETMKGIPRRSYFFTALLVIATSWSFALATAGNSTEWSAHVIAVAVLLFIMIILAEVLDITIPHPVITFTVSVTAALALASGLYLGPSLGSIVVMTAILVDGVFARRSPLKTLVNVAGYGLSTIAAGSLYLTFADPSQSPLGTSINLLALALASIVFTAINTWTLALIVAPVVGSSPLALWRANFNGTLVELIALPALGGLVPVLAAQHPLAVLVLTVPLLGPHLAFRGFNRAQEQTRVTMESLADALERRDSYVHNHSLRVTDYVSGILAEMPQVPFETAQAIHAAARVHDLGKVGIPDTPLTKPSALTADERAKMELHPSIGADIIGRLSVYRRCVDMVRHHHERWDGNGYPSRLAGEQIPLGARIITVADTFDAMTSDRPYRRALDTATALAEIERHSGTQFDPQVVVAFERAMAARLDLVSANPMAASPPAALRRLAPVEVAGGGTMAVGGRPIPARIVTDASSRE